MRAPDRQDSVPSLRVRLPHRQCTGMAGNKRCDICQVESTRVAVGLCSLTSRAVLSPCSATTALLYLRPWIGSLVLENWPADRSTHKNTDDINSTVEAVSLVALSIQVDFLDDDFDTGTVRALAHDKTGWIIHLRVSGRTLVLWGFKSAPAVRNGDCLDKRSDGRLGYPTP